MILSLLEVNKLSVKYGDLVALREVSLSIEPGKIVSLVGSNGSGKTTLINTLSGLAGAAAGSISFNGQPIQGMPAHRRVGLGLVQVPENRRLFPYMTVRENLEMGSMTQRSKDQRQENLDKVMEMFPILGKRSKQIANTLSGGEQRMLAIGRGLMSSPELLMLDEPSIGLAPIVVQEIFRSIALIKELGTTVLLVEQDVTASLKISSYGYVLENGEIVLSGQAQEVLASDKVREAYLGL
ncbi:MAG: ABC transporter ATP-binding protein [Desulfarculaceae bacterium]|nr:ABC transporter ATP-binding protein [Desulfarculaceae bacterium]MCF8073229.1 ABC transporter ATP-binding protein [Desulfarculaceae bacterium]MCF8100825.1 ABC transporter ATP-binding protein [Desulfarculaceae bacterium]MCF8117737.1 ABC transporter ATP-binding protein [Desulfarculaceae bacterium]